MTLLRWVIGMPNCTTNCYTIKPFDFWVTLHVFQAKCSKTIT